MARIDFAFGAADRLRTACVVTRKRYDAGERVVVYCRDARRLTAFDKLLWTFDDTTFIPHVGLDDPLAGQTPVVLTTSSPGDSLDRVAPATTPLPWLLNLDDEAPEVERFERVMEIVSGADDERLAARQRWRAYAAAGHDVHAHDLARAKGDTQS